MKLYRITVDHGTPQDRDRGQTRSRKCLYCGYDRLEALRVYHESRAEDFGGGNYTGDQRLTRAQSKEITADVA